MPERRVKSRSRAAAQIIPAEDAQKRADDLFAEADTMRQGAAREAVFEEACNYRVLAEMKRMMAARPLSPATNFTKV